MQLEGAVAVAVAGEELLLEVGLVEAHVDEVGRADNLVNREVARAVRVELRKAVAQRILLWRPGMGEEEEAAAPLRSSPPTSSWNACDSLPSSSIIIVRRWQNPVVMDELAVPHGVLYAEMPLARDHHLPLDGRLGARADHRRACHPRIDEDVHNLERRAALGIL